MSVDMFERRFKNELNKLPPFRSNDLRDERVWKEDFPAWRALFSAMCLFGHSTGYRLFSYSDFTRFCEHALTKKHPNARHFKRFFQEPLRGGMLQRISAWYESGMAETYLYACLAQALEDHSKSGIVLYDPRADWKLKADLIAIINQQSMRISAYVGERGDRPKVEARRDIIERERKRNTSESSHWGNETLKQMKTFEISRTDDDLQVVNGVRLFSILSVNKLLLDLYSYAGVGQEKRALIS